MDEHELNELLWRSCSLGMRIALKSLNTPATAERVRECVRLLGEVARGETALDQPQTDGAADRDLALRIFTGLDRTTTAAALPLHADLPPLRVDEGGVVRVGTSRVSLDLVIEQYENGMTPEEIVRAYDTLVPADVHAAIAYYLRHRDEVRAYLTRRAGESEALRTKIEAERPRVTRDELLARRRAREKDIAPTGQ